MSKRHYCDRTHLTLSERISIQMGIGNRATKVAIARTIGKDPTTVAKEIRKHRFMKPRNTFNYPTICIHRFNCKGCKSTENKCSRYEEQLCSQRDKSPGACNGCSKLKSCKLDKYYYDARKAEKAYRRELVGARSGINTDEEELKRVGEILSPLVNNGQSVYQALQGHPEISFCEKTIYNYIGRGVFKPYGLNEFSLKEQVNRRLSKSKIVYKKRDDRSYLEGRKYADYLKFKEENPDIPTVEMDTVYNHASGPYIQTMLFENSKFMIGFIHQEKTAASMAATFNYLEDILSIEVLKNLIPLCLTDRGPEFQKPELSEYSSVTGELRLRLFYCDPQQSVQKPHVENNHNYIRDILKNDASFKGITNEDLALIFSHINNTPRKSLNGKTPYEVFTFIYTEEITRKLQIKKLQPDEVILHPDLLKQDKK